MPTCPRCGKENVADAVFCTYCGVPLALASASGVSPAPVPSSVPPVETKKDVTGIAAIGIICAFAALVFLPPVFGIIAIVLGAYGLSKAPENQKRICWVSIILGIVFMVLGMLFSIYVALS
jgi:uncharacterized membrane protein YvbJ